jgi:uncharacterized protein (DUF927 family)
MRKLNEVYFAKDGEYGLTETQASHLCALAAQIKEEHEATLNNVNFVNTEMSIVGEQGEHVVDAGYTDLSIIEKALAKVSSMNAFISWFAEARKELESYRAEQTRYNLAEWCENMGKKYPDNPTNHVNDVEMSTYEDIVKEMSIKDRQTYLALEAKSAVYGKFIHPRNPMEIARNKMHKVAKAPYSKEGSGRDTLIYHYIPSVSMVDVDDLFNKLQAEYRETEQKLNHMKSDLRKKLTARNLEENNKKQDALAQFRDDYEKYSQELSQLTAEYNKWLVEENERIAKFRFIVPEKLADTEKYLRTLGK